MKTYYVVTFTPPGKTDAFRTDEDFNSLKLAVKYAKTLVKQGAKEVFIDTYDEDNDLVAYKQLKTKKM